MRSLIRITLPLILLTFLCVPALAQEPKPQETPAASPELPVSPPAPETPAPSSKGTIYFYRIKQFAGSALEPSVFCDEKELARMDNGRYFGVTLEPGTHTCRMGDKQTGFELEVKPGEEYYAKITIDAGFWKGHGRLTLLQKEQGAFELKKVKPLSASKVKNRELVTIYEGSEKSQ